MSSHYQTVHLLMISFSIFLLFQTSKLHSIFFELFQLFKKTFIRVHTAPPVLNKLKCLDQDFNKKKKALTSSQGIPNRFMMYMITQVADLDLPMAQCTKTTFLFFDPRLNQSTAQSMVKAVLLDFVFFLLIGAHPFPSGKVISRESSKHTAFY